MTICLKRQKEWVNTIKKFKQKTSLSYLILVLLISGNSFALSPEYQKQLKIGCYANSKQYIGAKRAKEYCTCTIKMLSKRYNDKEIDRLFKEDPEIITKKTQFASIHCEKNKLAF